MKKLGRHVMQFVDSSITRST